MRTLSFLAAVSVALAAAPSWHVLGQVTLNQGALEKLGPAPEHPAAPRPPAAASSLPLPRADAHAHPNGPHQSLPRLPSDLAVAKPAMPTVPTAPPPVPVLPPPIVVPTRPPAPPEPPTVAADAPGAASKTRDGLRVTFGEGSADLNQETAAAVRALAEHPSPDTTFSVTAYAAGTPDDPSTARRLSLSRALAVRSVLIIAGIASPRIYVKALGAAAPTIAEASPDRVDIVVEPPAPPPGQPAPAASQKAAP